MTENKKAELEKIAESLTTPELAHKGIKYIRVIQDGIKEMTQGKITAEPIPPAPPYRNDRDIDTANIIANYALIHEEENIGHLHLRSRWVKPERLRQMIEIAIQEYPTTKTIVEAKILDQEKETQEEKTKYKHVFTGPHITTYPQKER